jgi:hypothetical protein
MLFRGAFAAASIAAASIAIACGATTSAEPEPARRGQGDSDAGPPPASDSGASDGGRSCANDPVVHDFCDDFERPLYFGPGTWTRPNVYSWGRLRIENGSLVSEILEHDGGDSYTPAELFLERNWAVPGAPGTKRLTMKYRLSVERCSGTVSPAFLGGVNRPPWYAYGVQVWITQGVDCNVKPVGVLSGVDGGPTTYAEGTPIAIPTRTLVEYTISLEEIDGRVTVRLSTTTASSSASFTRASTGDVLTIIVGTGRPWLSGAYERLVTDDVRVDNGR